MNLAVLIDVIPRVARPIENTARLKAMIEIYNPHLNPKGKSLMGVLLSIDLSNIIVLFETKYIHIL